jgi:hypothetical protein
VLTSVFASTSAPFASSSLTASVWPCSEARMSGVTPHCGASVSHIGMRGRGGHKRRTAASLHIVAQARIAVAAKHRAVSASLCPPSKALQPASTSTSRVSRSCLPPCTRLPPTPSLRERMCSFRRRCAACTHRCRRPPILHHCDAQYVSF